MISTPEASIRRSACPESRSAAARAPPTHARRTPASRRASPAVAKCSSSAILPCMRPPFCGPDDAWSWGVGPEPQLCDGGRNSDAIISPPRVARGTARHGVSPLAPALADAGPVARQRRRQRAAHRAGGRGFELQARAAPRQHAQRRARHGRRAQAARASRSSNLRRSRSRGAGNRRAQPAPARARRRHEPVLLRGSCARAWRPQLAASGQRRSAERSRPALRGPRLDSILEQMEGASRVCAGVSRLLPRQPVPPEARRRHARCADARARARDLRSSARSSPLRRRPARSRRTAPARTARSPPRCSSGSKRRARIAPAPVAWCASTCARRPEDGRSRGRIRRSKAISSSAAWRLRGRPRPWWFRRRPRRRRGRHRRPIARSCSGIRSARAAIRRISAPIWRSFRKASSPSSRATAWRRCRARAATRTTPPAPAPAAPPPSAAPQPPPPAAAPGPATPLSPLREALRRGSPRSHPSRTASRARTSRATTNA